MIACFRLAMSSTAETARQGLFNSMSTILIDGKKIDIEAQLQALDRADCEDSLHTFFQRAWSVVDPSPFADGWPIEAVCEHLQAVACGEIRRLVINIPPRCSKSRCLSVAFPAWVWAQPYDGPISGPGTRFMFASYSQMLSLRDSVTCRRLIESTWYQNLWGNKFSLTGDQNTKHRFDNDKGGSRYSTSVGGTVTGEGGDCFVAGTLVSTPSKAVPIENIKPGDQVIAFDMRMDGNGGVVTSRVLATRAKLIKGDLCVITTMRGKRIICTSDHKIFAFESKKYEWTQAKNLKKDFLLMTQHGFDQISDVKITKDRKSIVYDIQVEAHSNFFADGILVHNCIILDDPNSAQEATSEAIIQSTIDWWDQAMSTRLNDPKTGSIIIIQQRLAENDLTGHVLEANIGGWQHLVLPMRYEWRRHCYTSIGWNDPRGLDDNGNPLVVVSPQGERIPISAQAQEELDHREGMLLWPERFDEEATSFLEKQMGPWIAAGQLQQRPEPKGGGIIKRDWWQLWEGDTYPPMDLIIASLDTAYTAKQENDPSAMTVWGVFSQAARSELLKSHGNIEVRSVYDDKPRIFLMYAWEGRYEFNELLVKVAKTCRDMKVDTLLVENKAAGHSIAQELHRLYAYEKFGIQMFDPRSGDKLSRLYSVQHLFADGLIYAPNTVWAEKVITQVGQFPRGKHDDLVDCTSSGIKYLREIGTLMRDNESQSRIEDSLTFKSPKSSAPLYPI